MNAAETIRITARPPGRRLVWLACFLMVFDVFFLPAWILFVAIGAGGADQPIEMSGQLVPVWFLTPLAVMSLLSVLGIAGIAWQTNALGFRVVSAVAIAWVVFLAVAGVLGVWWSLSQFASRLLIVGLLLAGRRPFARPLPADR